MWIQQHTLYLLVEVDVLGNQVNVAVRNDADFLRAGHIQRLAQTQMVVNVLGLGLEDQLLEFGESESHTVAALLAAILADDHRQLVVVGWKTEPNVCYDPMLH